VIEGEDLYAEGYRPRKQRKLGRGKKITTGQKTQITVAKAIKRRIKIDEAIVLADLAKRMGIKSSEIIKSMMAMGSMATVNQTIDFDTAALIASEFNYEVDRASFEEETVLKQEMDDPEKLAPRPPVVTIMGHVDHGKTSLLDVIRKSRISEMEAGGITQHIGAYHVTTEKGQIAFLDTPGHEAFTAMRARGAQITDIVVLVVAADDGVMPQTIEAINHAKAAEVPIIVAINKIDKQNAEPEKVQRELAEIGLTPEDWGGETIYVNVSAKQAQGIDDLLEMILLQAEVLELKANPEKLALGHVVEAKIDPGRGAAATILVREGTLRTGDPVVCGLHHGRIRAMLNDRGIQLESAGPSIPVEIVGLSGVPMAGDELIGLKDEKNAKQVSEHRQQKQRSKELAHSSRLSLDKLYERMQEGEVKDLNLIIKADVHGSIEALNDSLTKLSNEEVNVNVVHSASGTIAESDVSLATVSNAIIIGFNVRPSPKVQALATDENVDMRFYNVIYDVIKDVKSAMAGMMASTFEERILGTAEVREVFQIPKVGNIAGCYVTDGKIERGQNLRLLRDGVVIYEGKNSSLRRFKDDVKEVQSGYECGIGIENFNDIKVGDTIACYYLEEIRPELE
jgi:translation initiation factor IF-2